MGRRRSSRLRFLPHEALARKWPGNDRVSGASRSGIVRESQGEGRYRHDYHDSFGRADLGDAWTWQRPVSYQC